MELIKYELYKILSNKWISVLVIIFTIFNTVLFAVQVKTSMVGRSYANGILQKCEGRITNDKIKGIAVETGYENLREINNLKINTPEERFKTELFMKFSSVYNTYRSNQAYINEANRKINVTRGFEHKSNALFVNMMNKLQVEDFYYSGGWNNITEYIYNPIASIIAFLILLGLSSIFSGEYASKMDSLILSSKHGKSKLIRAKIIAALIFVLVLDVFFITLNTAGNLMIYGTHGYNAQMHFLDNYMNTPFNISIIEFYLIEILIHIIGCITFAFFIILLSSLCKTQISTFFLGSVALLIPFILDNVVKIKNPLVNLITRFSFINFIQVKKMFSSFIVYNILGHPVFYSVVAVVTMIIFIIISRYFIKENFKNHNMDF